jgi:hypothetical protein
MKEKLFYISILMVAILAGCGPAPAPTMSAADIQGTAVAAAWTVVAMTEISIPTATPLPPTAAPSPTSLPTFTPLAPPTSSIPTQAIGAFPTSPPPAAGGPTADACSKPIDPNGAGTKVRTNIQNQSGGSVVLSLYLFKTPFGECGYYYFNLEPAGSLTVDLLEGTYFAGAFVTGKKDTKSFGINLIVKAPSAKIKITAEEIREQ